jgi:ferredoxin--NADP+ reductase
MPAASGCARAQTLSLIHLQVHDKRSVAARLLQYNATLVERHDMTEALSIFRIRPDRLPKRRPWFAAGQYCVLGLNNTERAAPGAVRRPMSIASAPECDGPIEFYIRRIGRPVSPNPLTPLLWRLATGDRLYLRTIAAGVFTLRDTIGAADRRIRVMVAAGTGLAPFVSMVRSEVRRRPAVDLSKWVLLHGVSRPADLGYRGELQDLAARNGLKYWGTVSRPSEASGWTGDVGRVESYFAPDRLQELENRLGLPPGGFTPGRVVVYICGLTGTIAGVLVPLIGRGFVPASPRLREALGVPPAVGASAFYEDYDAAPVIDIDDPQVVGPLRARMQAALATR